MYAPFFGLTQPPFSIAPDPRYLFMSERHREALAHLLYGVGGGGGFVLLTGEIGAGKTTVCRCFLEQIPKRCNVAYIFNPKQTVVELLKSICQEFRIPTRHEGDGSATLTVLGFILGGLMEQNLRRALSITNVTEAGTVYTPAEVAALTAVVVVLIIYSPYIYEKVI